VHVSGSDLSFDLPVHKAAQLSRIA